MELQQGTDVNIGPPLRERALEVMKDASLVAQLRASRTVGQVRDVVEDHPLLAVGLALGGGVLLGAVAHRVLEHHVTLGELVSDRIGLDRARRRLRHAVLRMT